MIVSVTLNPAVDKTFLLADIEIDRLNRIQESIISIGGSGINASLTLSAFPNIDLVTTGFLGGPRANFIEDALRSNNITTSFVRIEGDTRTNHIVIDDKTMTQFNERGPVITNDEIDDFLETYTRIISNASVVIIAGSIPKGVTGGFYATLCSIAKEKNTKVILYTYENLFRKAVQFEPDILKADIRGAEELAGIKIDSEKKLIEACEKIKSDGAKNVVVGAEEPSQIFVTKDTNYLIKAPSVENPMSRIGSQDAVVAGLAYALHENKSLLEGIKMGVAAASAIFAKHSNYLTDFNKVKEHINNIDVKELK